MKAKVEYGGIDLFDIESLSAVEEYLQRLGFDVESKYDSSVGGEYLCVYPPKQEDPNA